MIILDTNVISEAMKPRPRPKVLAWLDECVTESLFLSAVTCAEIGFGLRSLPHGKKRRVLEEKFQVFLDHGFEGRILPFDAAAARVYGEIMGNRRRLGRPMSILDGQIAAIVRAHRYSIATGNVKDFEECGIGVINPFL